MRRGLCLAGAVLALTGLPGLALTPLPPCDGVVEAGMILFRVQPLGDYDAQTGATVEDYSNAMRVVDTVYVSRPGPTPALNKFSGARVTFCPTGEFVAIRGAGVEAVSNSLAATEFLRADVQAGRRVSFADIKRAARAVYGDVIVLRETEQTCACATFFPDLKPGGMTRFEDRTDVER